MQLYRGTPCRGSPCRTLGTVIASEAKQSPQLGQYSGLSSLQRLKARGRGIRSPQRRTRGILCVLCASVVKNRTLGLGQRQHGRLLRRPDKSRLLAFTFSIVHGAPLAARPIVCYLVLVTCHLALVTWRCPLPPSARGRYASASPYTTTCRPRKRCSPARPGRYNHPPSCCLPATGKRR